MGERTEPGDTDSGDDSVEDDTWFDSVVEERKAYYPEQRYNLVEIDTPKPPRTPTLFPADVW